MLFFLWTAGIPFSVLLLFPLAGFALALVLDLLQYVSSAIAWAAFFRNKDRPGVTRETEIGKAWRYINWPGGLCFFAKIAIVASAYVVLIAYIARQL